jgi:prolyl 4-hydroxylase
MTTTFSRQAADAAYGWGRPQDWPGALRLLEQAVKDGEDGADEQLALVTRLPLEELLTPPSPQRLHPDVRIATVEGFAPPGFSDWIIGAARDRLEPATMNDARGVGRRTATTCSFPPSRRDLVTAVLQHRAARLLAVPLECHEPPTVIHYDPGQEFGPHADFIEPSIPAYAAELATLGQRVGTFVTYLNDDFDGAETAFPRIDLRYRGKPGDAIFWANVLPDGSPDYRTMHEAAAPTRGEKWVFSQWIRAKPFPFAMLTTD